MDINGHDLMSELGIEGQQLGVILNHLLELVIDDPVLNKKETLLEEARKLNSQNN